ncbi:unnamed protein product [Closterium sp. NIES-53]
MCAASSNRADRPAPVFFFEYCQAPADAAADPNKASPARFSRLDTRLEMWNRATAGDSNASPNGFANARNSLRCGVRSLSSPALDSVTAPQSTLSRRRRSIDEARVATAGGAASRETSTQLPPHPKPCSPTTAYDVAWPGVHRANSDSYLARNPVRGAAVCPLELPGVTSTTGVAAVTSPQISALRHAARTASPIITGNKPDAFRFRSVSPVNHGHRESRLSRRIRRLYDVAARMSYEDAPSADTAASATRAASAGDAASGGDASVEVLGSNSRRVSAHVVVPASADVVWGVLTDYERLADFIPSLATNQMLQRRSNGARLLQVGEQDVAMGIKFRAKVVVDVEEGEEERLPRDLPRSFSSTDCSSSSSSSSSSGEESDAGVGRVGGSMRRRRIHFKMVEGDFQKFVGVWTLEEQVRFVHIYLVGSPEVSGFVQLIFEKSLDPSSPRASRGASHLEMVPPTFVQLIF